MNYIIVKHKSTGYLQMHEWPHDIADKNPYTALKRGYEIVKIKKQFKLRDLVKINRHNDKIK